MSSIIKFTHRNIDLGSGTRQEKIDRYIKLMGGPQALLEYILLNLKVAEENISDAKLIEDGTTISSEKTSN